MKDKVIYIIIGILIGAVVTAGGFLIFGKNNNTLQGRPDRMQMDANSTQGGFRGDENMTPPNNNPGNATTTTNETQSNNNI